MSQKSLFPSASKSTQSLFPSTESTPPTSLFPSAAAATPSLFPITQSTPSLFPSTDAAQQEEPPPPPADDDATQGWLRNSSFPQDLVSAANSAVPSSTPRVLTLNAPPPALKNKRRKTEDGKKKKKKKKDRGEDELITQFDIFELHTKPEKDNYRYGSLYSHDIPGYKPYIRWCLGAKKQEAVKRGKSTKVDSSSDPQLRYYKKLSPPELYQVHRSRFFRVNADYVSLTVSTVCWEPTVPITAALDPSKSDPTNPEKWIHFINSTGTTKAGLERRYQICEKARLKLPGNMAILRLLIETAEQLLPRDALGRLWTDLLFHQPHKPELWEHFLTYKETDLTELSYSSVLSAYRKCVATLLGFKRGTFRTHQFEGCVDEVLEKVVGRFISFLYGMGYTEHARSLLVSLVELATTHRTTEEYLLWWREGFVILGSEGYTDWWQSTVPSALAEPLTLGIPTEGDEWEAWLAEERRKEELCSGPIGRDERTEVVDPICRVSAPWLRQFLFKSPAPERLLESLLRVHLPAPYRELPLTALFCCDLTLLHRSTVLLSKICEQVYPRLESQTTVGVIRALLVHLTNRKGVGRFLKSLLKDPKHRNNIVYWSLYIDYGGGGEGMAGKLLATPLTPYYTSVLQSRGPVPGWDPTNRDKEIEQLALKNEQRTIESQLLGGYTCNMLVGNYRAHLHAGSLPPDYMERAVGKLQGSTTDIFTLFHRVLRTATGEVLTRAAVGAVEHFPQVDLFWATLNRATTLTRRLWDRLLKVEGEVLWRRRLEVELEKQIQNPEVNLRNRILSICVAALERWPHSPQLWDLYISTTQTYDAGSIKGVLVRSVRQNPSIKEYYLRAMQLCPEERETLYELLEEKQIRLRTLIEEIHMFRDTSNSLPVPEECAH